MADAESEYRIKAVIDASGALSGATEMVGAQKRMADGTDAAAAAARALTAAQQAAGAAAETLKSGAAGAAGQGVGPLGTLTTSTARALEAFGVSEERVSASARLMGTNLEIAGRAIVQMEQSKLADELERVRTGLEENAAAAQSAAESTGQLNNQQQESSDDGYTDNLESISAQLEDNQKKGANFTQEMGKMRESRRVAIELFETMEGGGHTIEGLTGLMRTLILTTDMLAPEYAALVAIGLALAGIVAAHEKTKDSADEVAASTAVAADETKRFDDNLKDLAKDNFWPVMADQAKTFTAELENQIKALDIIQKAEDQLRDAKTALKLANLDVQEQIALDGKSGPEADQIRARYTSDKDEVRAQAEREKSEAEIDAAKKRVDDLEKLIAAKDAEVTAATADASRTSSNVHAAQKSLNDAGDEDDNMYVRHRISALHDRKINAGKLDPETGEIEQPLTEAEELDLHNLTKAAPAIQDKYNAQGPQYDLQIERLKARLAELNAEASKNKGGKRTPEQLEEFDKIEASLSRMTALAGARAEDSSADAGISKARTSRTNAADNENAEMVAAKDAVKTAYINASTLDATIGGKQAADQNLRREANSKAVPPSADEIADQQQRTSADQALDQLGAEARATTGKGSAEGIRNVTASIDHVKQLIAEHQDLTGATADLAEALLQWKAGTKSEQDRMWAAIRSIRNGGNN